jgi:glyoxylase-like metal-dependent hydrolase (beta-lactamase superfamily II)
MKRVIALAALVAAAAGALALARPQAPQQAVAAIEKVKENLYVVTGGGGNTAAFITERGVVVVDTKLPQWGRQILDRIRSVTDKPITMIINTHTHGDHVSGNVEFPPEVEVVAHENCKASMEGMPLFQSAENRKFLPRRTYRDKLSLLKGRERIDLYHFGRGHTSGDSIVVFSALGVAHTGDLFANKGLPYIDATNGGSALAYPATLAAAGAKIKGVATVIPGHSAITDWRAFQEYGEFMRAFVDAVRASARAGKGPEEAAAALALPERFKDYRLQRLKEDVAQVYAEVKK